MSEDLQAVMRRIQKLLAIAGDDRADSNEAAAAASMAEKIMRKYELEHADVVRAEFKSAANFDTIDACVVMKKGKGHRPLKSPQWAQWLAVAVARMHDCEVKQAYNSDLGACVRFFGYKSDVQVCAWVFDYLTTQVIRSCRAFQKAAHREKSESESYRRGFVMRLLRSIDAAQAAKKAEQEAAVTSRELMVVKKAAISEHFGSFKYNDSKKVKVSDNGAFLQGSIDGAKVDVNRKALGTNAGGSALLLA